MDIEKLTKNELNVLNKRVDEEIACKETILREKVLAEVSSIAEKYGFSVQDLIEADKIRRRRAKYPPKYKDPKSKKTWNGMGRPPNWFARALEEGFTASDMSI